jgi:hypothetical protein
MGLDFNVPGTVKYPGSNGYTVRFRCDANYDIRTVLENATFNTFDDATGTGSYKTPGPASTVIMSLLNSQMQPIRNYTLVGAYVQNVGESTYNMGDNGQIVTIPATIAYQYWRVTQASLTPTVFSGN